MRSASRRCPSSGLDCRRRPTAFGVNPTLAVPDLHAQFVLAHDEWSRFLAFESNVDVARRIDYRNLNGEPFSSASGRSSRTCRCTASITAGRLLPTCVPRARHRRPSTSFTPPERERCRYGASRNRRSGLFWSRSAACNAPAMPCSLARCCRTDELRLGRSRPSPGDGCRSARVLSALGGCVAVE